MKKIKLLTTLILVLISTVSFTQEDEWTHQAFFTRFLKNGIMISDLDTNEDDSNVYGKNSYLNDKSQKIFELTKFDPDVDQMIPFSSGEIDSLKIDHSFNKDSTLFIYEMEFNWYEYNKKDKSLETARVFEAQIMNMLSEKIFSVIHIKYNNPKKDLYGWSEEYFYEHKEKQDISFPQVFKVRNIFLSFKDKLLADNPNDYVSYALLSNDSFCRYSKNGFKDKISFSERLDSVKEGNVSILIYKDSTGKQIEFTNLYLGDNTTFSAMADTAPFPYNSVNPKLTKDSLIVWEKINLLEFFLTLKNRQYYIGSLGFTKDELDEMTRDIKILEQVIKDILK